MSFSLPVAQSDVLNRVDSVDSRKDPSSLTVDLLFDKSIIIAAAPDPFQSKTEPLLQEEVCVEDAVLADIESEVFEEFYVALSPLQRAALVGIGFNPRLTPQRLRQFANDDFRFGKPRGINIHQPNFSRRKSRARQDIARDIFGKNGRSCADKGNDRFNHKNILSVQNKTPARRSATRSTKRPVYNQFAPKCSGYARPEQP
jgi:hypothetical protein